MSTDLLLAVNRAELWQNNRAVSDFTFALYGNSHFIGTRGHIREALSVLTMAVAACQHLNDKYDLSNPVVNLSNTYADLGQVVTAIDNYQETMFIAQELGDGWYEGNWLGKLGLAYAALGEVARVIDSYQQTLAIAQEIGDKRGEGTHAWNLGLQY